MARPHGKCWPGSTATCSQHTLTWYCGRSVANAVLLGRPIAPTGLVIDEGLRRLKGAGFDVVLIDPQYAPKVIAKHAEHDVDLIFALISAEPNFSPPILYGPAHNGIAYSFCHVRPEPAASAAVGS